MPSATPLQQVPDSTCYRPQHHQVLFSKSAPFNAADGTPLEARFEVLKPLK